MADDTFSIQQYWQTALSFEEYMDVAQRRVTETPSTDDYFQYYELGLHRMERTMKTFKLDEELLESLKAKNFKGKILIISEPWCGDASATVPAVALFFEVAGVEVRVFLRDSDTTLIDQFLTNGTRSIPKILVLDEFLEVKDIWGPRPQYGNELLAKFKADEKSYPREEFYNDLQVYYAKNRGQDAINEILKLV